MATYEAAIARARELFGAGDLPQAEAIYRRIVVAVPTAAEAWHELGVLCLQTGREQDAVDCLRQAVSLATSEAGYAVNLAAAYRKLGQPQDALVMVDRALQLRPDYPTAHFNRGNLLLDLDRFAEAAESFRNVVELLPNDEIAHCKLGLAHLELSRKEKTKPQDPAAPDVAASVSWKQNLDRAAACFRRACELRPDYAEAFANLAIALTDESDCAESDGLDVSALLRQAAGYWQRSLELNPAHAEGEASLAAILERLGRDEEALACWRRALALRPAFAAALNNLATTLLRQGQTDEAVDCWRRALEVQPDFTVAGSNLAAQWTQQGRISEAKACYQNILRFHPTEDLWRLCAMSLCPQIFQSSEELARYRDTLLGELLDLVERRPRFEVPALVTTACTPSFQLQFHGLDDRPIREAYARLFVDSIPLERPRGSTGKGRIGFVVTGGHERVFVKHLGGVLEHLNGDLFDVAVVCAQSGLPAIRAGIGNEDIRLIGVANRFAAYADAIRAAELDVLYHWEVGTDSLNYFLPFLRLAPLQCTSWGVQVTSGNPRMDHYLSSELVEPDDAQDHYTENLVRSSTLLTYQRRVRTKGVQKSRQAFGIPHDRHIYLCAQQLGKFHPEFDPTLAAILRRDERGVLVITGDRHGGAIVNQLRQRFMVTMADVVERVMFLPLLPNDEYLQLVAVADVLLDPLHFAGSNTSYDAFSLNQPIVTLPTRFERSRYTLGCYRKMELSECVARDAANYVEIALALGTDAHYRAEVIERLRRSSDVLFEDMQAVREHERIFSQLVERSRSGDHARN